MGGLFSERAWAVVLAHKANFIQGFSVTVESALGGILIAAVLGVLLGLMGVSSRKVPKTLNRIYVEAIQNTPLILQLCILYYALSFSGHKIGVLAAGIISLGIYHGAYMAEVIRAGIEAVPKGQFEAGYAQGFNMVQVMWYIILPQAFRKIVPTLMSQVITIIKDTSFMANVATIELMARVNKVLSGAALYNGTGTINVSDVFVLFGFAALVYFVINYTLSCAVRHVQASLEREGVTEPVAEMPANVEMAK